MFREGRGERLRLRQRAGRPDPRRRAGDMGKGAEGSGVAFNIVVCEVDICFYCFVRAFFVWVLTT